MVVMDALLYKLPRQRRQYNSNNNKNQTRPLRTPSFRVQTQSSTTKTGKKQSTSETHWNKITCFDQMKYCRVFSSTWTFLFFFHLMAFIASFTKTLMLVSCCCSCSVNQNMVVQVSFFKTILFATQWTGHHQRPAPIVCPLSVCPSLKKIPPHMDSFEFA